MTFLSEFWDRRVSDAISITDKSVLLDLLKPGDNVMVDRGFNVGVWLNQCGITLNIVSFLRQRDQIASRELEETQ